MRYNSTENFIEILYLLMALTIGTSFIVFQYPYWFATLVTWPHKIVQYKEWHRIITGGFIHANRAHLFFNMMTFYFFGRTILQVYYYQWQEQYKLLFIVLYVGGIVVANLFSTWRYAEHINWSSLGASGGVSAVLAGAVLFYPRQIVLVFGLLPIPGFLYIILYLGISYSSIDNGSNTGHYAHFVGTLYGIFFNFWFFPSLFRYYINSIKEWFYN